MKRSRPPYDNEHICIQIDRLIHSARDRQIIKMSLCDGAGYEAIGEAMGISRSTVARVVPRCEKILFETIKAPKRDDAGIVKSSD